MISFQKISITQWVSDLFCDDRLLILCGIQGTRAPGVVTYYDFMQRLENGPQRGKNEDAKAVRWQ